MSFQLRLVSIVLLASLSPAQSWCAETLTPAQRWALSTTGILTELRNERHDTLSGLASTPEAKEIHRQLLENRWGITTREDFLERLRWFEEHGDRRAFQQEWQRYKSGDTKRLSQSRIQFFEEHEQLIQPGTFLAWDLTRGISHCRFGAGAGYISASEAWSHILPMAAKLRASYRGWAEMATDYLAGADYWDQNDDEYWRRRVHGYQKLFSNPASPWRNIPWDAGAAPVETAASVIPAAQIVVTPWPTGLTCIRVILYGAKLNPELVGSARNALGCEPRIFDTEETPEHSGFTADCTNGGEAQSGVYRSRIHLEPIARQLASAGIRDVMLSVAHKPAGNSSVRPFLAAHRSYADDGWDRLYSGFTTSSPVPDLITETNLDRGTRRTGDSNDPISRLPWYESLGVHFVARVAAMLAVAVLIAAARLVFGRTTRT